MYIYTNKKKIKKNMELPIYELFLEDDESVGLSLVDYPAIEENFIYFSSNEIKLSFNEEKMIVKGPALIPYKKIYRNDIIGERYVFMNEETVKQFAEIFLNKVGDKFNINHSGRRVDLSLVESYFTSNKNEFNVPEGSWIVAYKVKDKQIWDMIKSGELNGFSIEGLFNNELTNQIFNKQSNNMKEELKSKILNAINSILFGEETIIEQSVETVTETPVVEEPVVETPVVEQVVEPVIETVVVEPEKDDKYEALINEIKSLRDELKNVNEKVERYGEQPITQNVVAEQVANTTPLNKKQKAAEYFK